MRSGLGPQVRPSVPVLIFAMPTVTNEIEIVVNGTARRSPAGQTLDALLVWLGVDPERVAVELNRAIIQRQAWSQTPIESGAALEIVQFVGGG